MKNVRDMTEKQRERLDAKALEAAIEKLLKEEPDRKDQIDDHLRRDGRWGAGHFATYCLQAKNLHLKPWETPPCWIADPYDPSAYDAADDDIKGDRKAVELCRKMHELGISHLHHDPLRAIAEAKAKAAQS